MQSLQSCSIVMASNLCFSFRGLYQKLFRASPEGGSQLIDDLNLQFRMQQIGVATLVIPVLMIDLRGVIYAIWQVGTGEIGLIQSGALFTYFGLALVNGIAFTCYK